MRRTAHCIDIKIWLCIEKPPAHQFIAFRFQFQFSANANSFLLLLFILLCPNYLFQMIGVKFPIQCRQKPYFEQKMVPDTWAPLRLRKRKWKATKNNLLLVLFDRVVKIEYPVRINKSFRYTHTLKKPTH